MGLDVDYFKEKFEHIIKTLSYTSPLEMYSYLTEMAVVAKKQHVVKSKKCCDNPNKGFYGMNAVKCYNCGWIKEG